MDAVEFLKIKNRMCHKHKNCDNCPLLNEYKVCRVDEYDDEGETVAIVEQWVKENPVKTRQSEFLKLFPNAGLFEDGIIGLCPNKLEGNFYKKCSLKDSCQKCRKEYWLAEVNE